MWFNYRTKNIQNDIQKKNPLVWVDLDPSQLLIYIFFGVCAFFFIVIAKITVFWKVIAWLICFLSAIGFTKKYNDRTMWKWFRIYTTKQTKWSVSVDKWADYENFVK